MIKLPAFLACLALLVALATVSLFVGVTEISLAGLWDGAASEHQNLVLAASRIPRTLALILAGSSLGIAGLVMQIILRNRFVEPSTVGTTEAAALGFLTVTILAPGWPMMAKMVVSAAFALAGTALFLRLTRFIPPREVLLVPLVGIMLAGVIGSVQVFIAYRNELLASTLAWQMGDFSGVLRGRFELLWFGLGATILAWLAADRLTVAGLGSDFTTNLGLSYRQVVALGLIIVAVVSSVNLVTIGAIPFLGLVVPNIVSMMVGDNMRATIPWVALTGATFVTACDILGRLLRYPYEIPIAVIVGVIGSGIFLWLLLRSGRNSRA